MKNVLSLVAVIFTTLFGSTVLANNYTNCSGATIKIDNQSDSAIVVKWKDNKGATLVGPGFPASIPKYNTQTWKLSSISIERFNEAKLEIKDAVYYDSNDGYGKYQFNPSANECTAISSNRDSEVLNITDTNADSTANSPATVTITVSRKNTK